MIKFNVTVDQTRIYHLRDEGNNIILHLAGRMMPRGKCLYQRVQSFAQGVAYQSREKVVVDFYLGEPGELTSKLTTVYPG